MYACFSIEIENHLGKFAFDPAQSLTFKNGIIGFAGLETFALANLPQEGMEAFKLLQSLDVHELAFIVLPYDASNAPLEQTDIDDLAAQYEVTKENLAFLFIVTIRTVGENVRMTMNQRAPIVLDIQNKTGRQHILTNQNYDVQYDLSQVE